MNTIVLKPSALKMLVIIFYLIFRLMFKDRTYFWKKYFLRRNRIGTSPGSSQSLVHILRK